MELSIGELSSLRTTVAWLFDMIRKHASRRLYSIKKSAIPNYGHCLGLKREMGLTVTFFLA